MFCFKIQTSCQQFVIYSPLSSVSEKLLKNSHKTEVIRVDALDAIAELAKTFNIMWYMCCVCT